MEEIKKRLIEAPTLAFFDPKRRLRVSHDAYGVGVVLEQFYPLWKNKTNIWKLVYYASSALTPTEQRYTQIEKEAQAPTLACKKVLQFIIGAPGHTLHTDHKPIVSLIGSNSISELSPRLQRFQMRLNQFSYTIERVPGKA
ncbi:hypothetical protein J437_LFUL005195 [Ladona fulva]|uniref:Reverse transcriptase RNase H-like domain-containing protein n=1 Tax=Ladona fulva TaxID=123851 RepID=A0A8K0KM08_LADFU|nr:hypothetical protein J437_LFUL005195 [Ladona fulva]